MFFFFFFFFSSRRRHTRLTCDWSSDVCSSDLDHRRVLGLLVAEDAAARHRLVQLSAHNRTRRPRSEEHTSELQSHVNLVCRLLLEKKKNALDSLFRSILAASFAHSTDF